MSTVITANPHADTTILRDGATWTVRCPSCAAVVAVAGSWADAAHAAIAHAGGTS